MFDDDDLVQTYDPGYEYELMEVFGTYAVSLSIPGEYEDLLCLDRLDDRIALEARCGHEHIGVLEEARAHLKFALSHMSDDYGEPLEIVT